MTGALLHNRRTARFTAGFALALCVTAVGCGNPPAVGGGGDDAAAPDLAGDPTADAGAPDSGGGDLAPPDLSPPPDLMPLPDLGGVLAVTEGTPPAELNLTTEGSSDWAHWGLVWVDVKDHKSGVTSLISDATVIGGATLHQYTDNQVAFDWSDGAPDATASATRTGIFVYGQGNGFSITVPAEPTLHTLRLYISSFLEDYTITASVSDGSAYTWQKTLVNNITSSGVYSVYAFTYKAKTPGQQLKVQWVGVQDHLGSTACNVTLQAATLQ